MADEPKQPELSHEEWLEKRQETIGSSDAPIIALGGTEYCSLFSLWVRKKGLIPEDEEESEAIEYGRLLEPYVAELYKRKTKREMKDLGRTTLQVNPKYPFAHSTIDRVVFDVGRPQDQMGIAELKTTGGFFAEQWSDEAPIQAQIQLQHQLAVGLKDNQWVQWGSVAGLIGGFRFRFRYQDIPRDQEFIDMLMDKEHEFYQMVKDGREPPIDASSSTAQTLKELYPSHREGKTVPLPGIAIDWDEKLVGLKVDEKRIQGEMREFENKLKAEIGDAEFGLLPSGSSYSLKKQTRPAHTVKESTFRVLLRRKDKK